MWVRYPPYAGPRKSIWMYYNIWTIIIFDVFQWKHTFFRLHRVFTSLCFINIIENDSDYLRPSQKRKGFLSFKSYVSAIFFIIYGIKSSYCHNKKYETENLATILSWSRKVFHFLYVMHIFSFWFLFFLLYFIKEFKISWFTNKYATVIFM